jgi:hypothetical protein
MAWAEPNAGRVRSDPYLPSEKNAPPERVALSVPAESAAVEPDPSSNVH